MGAAKRAEKRKPPKLIKPPKAANDAQIVPLNLPPPWVKITDSAVGRSLRKRGLVPDVFSFPQAPPGVIPKGADMANDEALSEVNNWAGGQTGAAGWFGGQTWLGYTYLSELAQQPEYRRITEVLATEATRKWIKFSSTATDEQTKTDKITELEEAMTQLDVQGAFRKLVELDGFFGRSHLYIDTGASDDLEELKTPIGTGCDRMTLNKFKGKKGFLKALRPVEPIWVYPARYNATDPLQADWYLPTNWYVQGKQIHGSRLLTFVGREVPDLLKPTYAFGGLSLSQMAKPYVDNWLRTRQAVADLVWSFSVRGLKTNLATLLAADGEQLMKRADLFANFQNNQGLMLIDKDSEEFFNIQTGLGSLNDLQAQAQEHMASVTGTPIVKLLGIQPAGLNASSQGELTVWYDWVEAFQEKFIKSALTSIINFIMLSIWGEVDPDIVFAFESLRALTELEASTVRKQEADTDVELIGAGVISPEDARRRIASDPNSPYDGLDVADVPEAPEGGLMGQPGEGEEPDAGGSGGLDLGPREDRLDRSRDRTRARPARDRGGLHPDPTSGIHPDPDKGLDPSDDAAWSEGSHKRGQPGNAGQFASGEGGGGGGKGKTEAPGRAPRGTAEAPARGRQRPAAPQPAPAAPVSTAPPKQATPSPKRESPEEAAPPPPVEDPKALMKRIAELLGVKPGEGGAQEAPPMTDWSDADKEAFIHRLGG